MSTRPARLLTALLSVWALLPVVVSAQSVERPPDAQYADVEAKEKAVRAAFSNTLGPGPVIRAVRTVVGEYEDLVRRFPGAAFSAAALWNASSLAADAFRKYGDPQERDTTVRLLKRLEEEYAASPEARKAAAAAAAIEATVPSIAATRTPGIATISGIRRQALPEVVRVIIDIDGEVHFREERLSGPDRVFVDLFATRLSPSLSERTLRFDGDILPVRQVRIGLHPDNVTRVVLETAGISTCSVYSLYEPYRLVIECIPERDAEGGDTALAEPDVLLALAAPVASSSSALLLAPQPLAAGAFDSGWGYLKPGLPSAPPPPVESAPLLADAFDTGWGYLLPGLPSAPAPPPPAAAAVPETRSPPTAPPANLAGGFSVARQLGLGVSRIVIDPGHGGHDPGAKGNELTEAAIVLDIALRLEKIFEAVPDVEVILTRRTDEYVSLEERSAIANREHADLFLSIHANGSRNTRAEGVETYFLNFATSEEAAALAARENATSAQAMAALPEVIKAITLSSKRTESRDFATLVQRALVRQLRPANRDLKDLGVKQAPFMVLVGAAMPAVLTEISFVTNADEARLLRNPSYRQRVAHALFEATRTYQSSLKGPGAAVALQRPAASGSAPLPAGSQP